MWGDGKQTRSFIYIDDCVDGTIWIMESDCSEPLNLGTEEMIDMNGFAKLAMSFEGKKLPIVHIKGPEGVRGRNSDNTMIRERIGWEPQISIKDGLRKTHAWIKGQIEKEKVQVITALYSSSSTSYFHFFFHFFIVDGNKIPIRILSGDNNPNTSSLLLSINISGHF